MVGSLSHSILVEVLELLNLSPVILSLELEDLDFLVQIGCLESELSIRVAFLGIVLVQAKALKVSVVQESLLARKLLLKIVALLVPTKINTVTLYLIALGIALNFIYLVVDLINGQQFT